MIFVVNVRVVQLFSYAACLLKFLLCFLLFLGGVCCCFFMGLYSVCARLRRFFFFDFYCAQVLLKAYFVSERVHWCTICEISIYVLYRIFLGISLYCVYRNIYGRQLVCVPYVFRFDNGWHLNKIYRVCVWTLIVVSINTPPNSALHGNEHNGTNTDNTSAMYKRENSWKCGLVIFVITMAKHNNEMRSCVRCVWHTKTVKTIIYDYDDDYCYCFSRWKLSIWFYCTTQKFDRQTEREKWLT